MGVTRKKLGQRGGDQFCVLYLETGQEACDLEKPLHCSEICTSYPTLEIPTVGVVKPMFEMESSRCILILNTRTILKQQGSSPRFFFCCVQYKNRKYKSDWYFGMLFMFNK